MKVLDLPDLNEAGKLLKKVSNAPAKTFWVYKFTDGAQ